MTAIDALFNQPVAQAVGWALVHFVWQGTLIAAVTALLLAALGRSAADVRYVVATIALTLMVTMPTVTALQAWRTATKASGVNGAPQIVSAPAAPPASAISDVAVAQSVEAASTAAATPVVDAGSFVDRVIRRVRVEPWIPGLLSAWLCGVALLTLRLASGWMWVQRTKSHSAEPAADHWQQMAARLSRRLHISRPIRLLESAIVEVPTVIGWLKPVVLLPTSALAGLTPQQMEAILAHELAHIRRHDYLVNLLQALVETLLFYHPAVWWLSRRIRTERENCCDDLAVSLCGDPVTYASALADLEELRGGGRELVMAASGGSLLHRVRRLLGAPTHAGRPPGWLAGCTAIVLMFGMAAGVVGNEGLLSGGGQAVAAPLTAAEQQKARTADLAAELAARAAQADLTAARAMAELRAVLERQRATSRPEQAAAHAAEMAAASRAMAEVRAALEAQKAAQPIDPATYREVVARTEALMRSMAADQSGIEEVRRSAERMAVAARADTEAAIAAAARLADVHTSAAAEVAAARAVEAAHSATAAMTGASAQEPVRTRGRERGRHTWSHNGEKFELDYEGEIEFNDDDTDIRSLSPGGYFKMSDGGWFGGRGVDIRADASGNLSRRFRVGMIEKPYEPEGRVWLAQMLPRFIRQSGIGAPARVARILKSKGPAGVLSEISLIEGSYGKRVYFTQLFKTASLDAATVRQAFAQASREVSSDYELASLLIASQHFLTDDSTRKAYFDASSTIQSDYEMRRVLNAGLKTGPVAPAVLASILDRASTIQSDYELASLLVQVAKQQPLDSTTRRAFFTALESVGGAYEHGRVLQALAARSDLSSELLVSMLQSGARMRSDYEQAQFLLQIVKAHPIDATLRGPFFAAVDAMRSPYEKGRVLQAVAKRTDTPPDTVVALLRSAGTITGNYERAQVLFAVAATHPISGPARDAYIAAAEKLGDYEQGRALTALVKNERGRR